MFAVALFARFAMALYAMTLRRHVCTDTQSLAFVHQANLRCAAPEMQHARAPTGPHASAAVQEIQAPQSQQDRMNEWNPTHDAESGQAGGQSDGQNRNQGGGGSEDGEEEEEEQPVLTVTAELITLFAISIVVAMASECASASLDLE